MAAARGLARDRTEGDYRAEESRGERDVGGIIVGAGHRQKCWVSDKVQNLQNLPRAWHISCSASAAK